MFNCSEMISGRACRGPAYMDACASACLIIANLILRVSAQEECGYLADAAALIQALASTTSGTTSNMNFCMLEGLGYATLQMFHFGTAVLHSWIWPQNKFECLHVDNIEQSRRTTH
jgi:hypothetical protein